MDQHREYLAHHAAAIDEIGRGLFVGGRVFVIEVGHHVKPRKRGEALQDAAV